MQVQDIMTRDVRLAGLDDTVLDVARVMAEHDIGFMPVTDGERLAGIITDRDIAIRAIAEGRGPDCKVAQCMTPDVRYCYEDQDLSGVAANMGDIQVRRLPVVDRNKRLVGVLALGDIATHATLYEESADALGGISRRDGADPSSHNFL